MLIGYVSDEQHVAIADAQVEFIRGDEAVETRSSASGAVRAEILPGRWTATLAQRKSRSSFAVLLRTDARSYPTARCSKASIVW